MIVKKKIIYKGITFTRVLYTNKGCSICEQCNCIYLLFRENYESICNNECDEVYFKIVDKYHNNGYVIF